MRQAEPCTADTCQQKNLQYLKFASVELNLHAVCASWALLPQLQWHRGSSGSILRTLAIIILFISSIHNFYAYI